MSFSCILFQFSSHYSLGVIYEDLQDHQQARREYNLALMNGSPLAGNNLARLYLLSGDPTKYPQAINLLQKAFSYLANQQELIAREDRPKVEYALYKNLGWARLKQSRYQEAQEALETAISINNESIPAHCLLAQTLEKLAENQALTDNNKQKQLETSLEICANSGQDFNQPEEDEWIYLAQEKLKKLKAQKPKP